MFPAWHPRGTAWGKVLPGEDFPEYWNDLCLRQNDLYNFHYFYLKYMLATECTKPCFCSQILSSIRAMLVYLAYTYAC